ncbi:hypothetical protein [Aestuariivirga sp.]|uniref:hypothetical protein n=1 Tax=Aestuariivirga sp. TaxID=2650926 RepID=UPI0039E25CDB
MTTENDNTGAPKASDLGKAPQEEIEASFGTDVSMSTTVNDPTNPDGDVLIEGDNEDGDSIELDGLEKADEGNAEEATAESSTEEASAAEEKAEGAEEKPQEAHELGDFDPKDVKKWDAKYVDNTGLLNMETFEAEVEANFTKTGKAELNAQTLEYLSKSRGIKKEDAQFFIEQRLAASQRDWAGFTDTLGGQPVVDAAYEWAKANYTQEQKDEYNAAYNGGSKNLKTYRTQLELLVRRYQTATGEKPVAAGKAKDYGTGRKAGKDAGKVEGYKDAVEERKALSEIMKMKDESAKQRSIRDHHAKIRASAYYSKKG